MTAAVAAVVLTRKLLLGDIMVVVVLFLLLWLSSRVKNIKKIVDAFISIFPQNTGSPSLPPPRFAAIPPPQLQVPLLQTPLPAVRPDGLGGGRIRAGEAGGRFQRGKIRQSAGIAT